MGFSSNSTNWSGKAKICDFIGDLVAFLLEEYIFGLDVSMNEVFLMDALKSFHDFDDDFDGLFKREYLAWKFSLVGEKVALLAILHDDNDEVVGWMKEEVLVN